MSNNSINGDSVIDNDSDVLSNESFSDEPINSDHPHKTVSDNDNTINSVEYHWSVNVTSIEM